MKDSKLFSSSINLLSMIFLASGSFLCLNCFADCKAEDDVIETHFAVDFSQQEVKMLSSKDRSSVIAGACKGSDSQFLQVNILSLVYQEDIRADEFFQNQQMESSCSIVNSESVQAVSFEKKSESLNEKRNFIDNCLQVRVADQSEQPLAFVENHLCRFEISKKNRSEAVFSGQLCLLKTNPNSNFKFKTVLRPECLSSQHLQKLGIPRMDVETRLGVYQVSDSTGRPHNFNIVTKRDTRWTLMPPKGLMPLSQSQDGSDLEYSSTLTTNVDQGPIAIRPIGNDRAVIDVKFLAQNFGQRVCDANVCSGPADFNTPLVGRTRLYKIQKSRKVLIHEWDSTYRLPPQWIGIANPLFNIELGKPTSSVIIPEALQSDEHFEIETEFYEPKSYLDSIANLDLTEMTNFEDTISFDPGAETLPRLPSLGRLQLRQKLPSLPSVHLGYSTSNVDIPSLIHSAEWSHYYDRVCDNKNRNCSKLRADGSAFLVLKTHFKVDGKDPESGLLNISNIEIEKSSDTFGSKKVKVQTLPSRQCK